MIPITRCNKVNCVLRFRCHSASRVAPRCGGPVTPYGGLPVSMTLILPSHLAELCLTYRGSPCSDRTASRVCAAPARSWLRPNGQTRAPVNPLGRLIRSDRSSNRTQPAVVANLNVLQERKIIVWTWPHREPSPVVTVRTVLNKILMSSISDQLSTYRASSSTRLA